MAIFYEDARSPIVAELIRQGFEVDESEALRILDIDETAHNTDGAIALGTGAACIAATAGTLALAGFTLPILLPALGIGLCGVSYWNSKITARDRETETQFIQDHPEVLNKVQTKIRTGAARDSIAAAYQQVLRSYRWGDDVPLDRVLGKSESQTQSIGIEESASMTSVPSLATNETQPIAQTTAAAPSFVSPNLTPPKTRSELIARLKQDCPLLLKLVKSHPIRAVGVQRSGKTTLVKRLALLRMVLLEGHSVTASTPHYEEVNQYPDVFSVAGIRNGQRDYPAIERAWSKMASDVESCQMGNITYIWDEFGLIDKAIPITPESDPIKTVLTSCLRETMKFQIYPIFILHGETAAFLPGSKGLVTVIMASTVRVETIGEPVEGDDGLEMIRPTGRFNVTWLDGSKGEGILPAWLSENFLIGMIPGRKIEKEQPIAPLNYYCELPLCMDPSLGPVTEVADEWLEEIMESEDIPQADRDKARAAQQAIKLERFYKSSASNKGPYTDEIRGTWREDFAKNMPPGVDEAEFLRLYNLEKSLQESSVPKEQPIGIDCKPIAVLHDYLKRRGPKSLKPTVSAMRNTNAISETDLDEELERHDNYQDGIHQLLVYGCEKGFFICDSEGNFSALDKH